MSSFHTPPEEIDALRGWYIEDFETSNPEAEQVGRPQRRRQHPTIDPEQMICRNCRKRCLSNNPFEDLDEDTISIDSDYVPESPDSTTSSPMESEFSDDGRDTDLTQEAHNLSMGLTEWELHDLARLGHSPETLSRQFPEMENVHDRFVSRVPENLRRFKQCLVCQKEHMPEVEDAIIRGVVLICSDCDRPCVRHDENGLYQSLLDLRACFCRCSCPEEPQQVGSGPIWFPFFARVGGTTPSPAALSLIQELGFCVRDTVGEQLRDAIARNEVKPRYHEIITGTIPDYLKSTSSERLTAHSHDICDAAAFPNGVLKDSNTDSGLPSDLETAIRQLDPNAFGHVTRARYQDHFEPSATNELSWDERHRWDRILYMRHCQDMWIGTDHGAAAQLARWAAEYEHDFGLEDDDGDSICSMDDLGEPAWEVMNQIEIEECGCGHAECGERKHNSRHYKRKLERVAARGGYPVFGDDAHFAAGLQIGYDDRVRRQGLIVFRDAETDTSNEMDGVETEAEPHGLEYLEDLLERLLSISRYLNLYSHEELVDSLTRLLSRDANLSGDLHVLSSCLEVELERNSPDHVSTFDQYRSLTQLPPQVGEVPAATQLTNADSFNNSLAGHINGPDSGIDPNGINGGQISAFSDDSDIDYSEGEEEEEEDDDDI